MDLDLLIKFGVAIVTLALGYLGVHMALHELPGEPLARKRARRKYKWGFILLSASAMVFIVWQGLRDRESQLKTSAEFFKLARAVAVMRTESAQNPSTE